MRIATFNMHHGKEDLVPYTHQAMVGSVAELQADIVCLQETDIFSLRTRFANQPMLIAKKLGYKYVSGLVRFFKLGFQHNAILSKFPIVAVDNIVLPHVGGQQKRKALIVEVQTNERVIKVATTHLHARKDINKPNEHAINQLDFLFNYCAENNVEILVGDFNLLPKDVNVLAQKYGFLSPDGHPTSPAKNPRYQIDWITTKGLGLSDIEVSGLLSSDHRALIASVKL